MTTDRRFLFSGPMRILLFVVASLSTLQWTMPVQNASATSPGIVSYINSLSIDSTGSSGSLMSVSCPIGGDCIAVGVNNSNGQSVVFKSSPLGWNAIDVASLIGLPIALNAISCAAPGTCVAVGVNTATSAPVALSEVRGQWGAVLTLGDSPNGTGSNATLNSVSCSEPGFCVAVGVDNLSLEPVLVTESDGNWGVPSETPSDSFGGLGTLNSISCSSVGRCEAVGQNYDNGYLLVISETNGVWSDANSIPVDNSMNPGNLNSVSCPTSRFCLAVGDDLGTNQPISVEFNNGSWAATNSLPVLNASGQGLANAIDCPVAGRCYAVGTNLDSNQLMVAEFAGGEWGPADSIVQQYSSDTLQLNSVSCSNSSNCIVGGEDLNLIKPIAGWIALPSPTSVMITNLPSALQVGQRFVPTVVSDADGALSITSKSPLVCDVNRQGVISTYALGLCTLFPEVGPSANYSGLVGSSESFAVTQATQTGFSFSNVPTSVLGSVKVALQTSGGVTSAPVTFAISGPCRLDSNIVTDLAPGSCSVTATDQGNADYAAATTTASIEFVAAPQTQLAVRANHNHAWVGRVVRLGWHGGSGQIAPHFATTSPGCWLSGNYGGILHRASAGTCVVSATNPANGVYASATSNNVTVTFSIKP